MMRGRLKPEFGGTHINGRHGYNGQSGSTLYSRAEVSCSTVVIVERAVASDDNDCYGRRICIYDYEDVYSFYSIAHSY